MEGNGRAVKGIKEKYRSKEKNGREHIRLTEITHRIHLKKTLQKINITRNLAFAANKLQHGCEITANTEG